MEEEITIECGGLSAMDIAEKVRSVESGKVAKLMGGEKLHSVGGGQWAAEKLVVDCSLGDFAAMLGNSSHTEISGNVGSACGCSLAGGTVIVRGSAGNQLAIHAAGGFVAVFGKAGDFCGQGLDGADVFVRSLVGRSAGFAMASGTLVLGNGAGENLGHRMRGGVIYVRGEVASVSPDVKSFRLKDADTMRISLLLARVGIKSDGKDFKAYRPRGGVGK
ncbi:MAG: hypothetical protein Aurels2KO_27560 [Aureliella sp.]